MAIGGRTPKASAVRKTTCFGCPPRPVGTMLRMYGSGYDARVFSVIFWLSNLTLRVDGSSSTFSRIVPNICVVR